MLLPVRVNCAAHYLLRTMLRHLCHQYNAHSHRHHYPLGFYYMPLNVTLASAPQNQPSLTAGHSSTAHDHHLAGDLLIALLKKTGYAATPLPAEIGNVTIDSNNIDFFNEIFVKTYTATRDKKNVQDIRFDNAFTLSLLDCDGGLVIAYGEKVFELSNITIELLTNLIISDYHDHPAAYDNTLLADFILMQTALSDDTDKIDIHKKIDILHNIYHDIPQPCFIAAAYMMAHRSISPFDFSVPASILAPLRQGGQFDIGLCMLDGNDISQERHGVDFTLTRHDNQKTSLQANVRPRDLFNHAAEIRHFLAANFGDHCIFLTSSYSAGHFCYYDIKNDIVYSGGTKALSAAASGIHFVDYMATKYNKDNEKQQITLFCTNNSADEVAKIIDSF
ncbi:hypothetical protein [Sodalis sp. C49]|uniref:hypothetical protein n=1 Tax=Sodalis sp. C49 TaxID=3228929 RepID=UPI003965B72C